MKVLFGYPYSTGTTPYYYERALRRQVEVVTCGPSTDPQKRQDFPCTNNANINPILKEVEPDYFLLFPEGNTLFLPLNVEKINIPKILLLSDTYINYYWQQYYAKIFDFIFIAQKSDLEFLKTKGMNAYLLPHAFDPEIFKDYKLPRKYEISFVGTINDFQRPKRSLYLDVLKQNFNMVIFNNLWFEKAAKIYSQSKIVFNISAEHDLGSRFFESMSCGALLLTDKISKNLNNLFIEKKHFIAYRSPSEAVKLIRYYLSHSKQRERIARRGQEETLRCNTYQDRVKFILQTINTNSCYSSSKNPLEDIQKTYLYLNHPSYKPRKLIENNLLSFTNYLSKLPYTKRRKVIAVLTKINMRQIQKIANWFYYLLRLQLNRKLFNRQQEQI